MKAIKLTLAVLALSVLLPLSNAHAQFFQQYAEMYTVGSEGSTVAQSNFNINQAGPWLFIELYPTDPGNSALTNRNDFFTVTTPGGTVYNPYTSSTGNDFWVHYDAATWNGIKQVGSWTVSADSLGSSPADGVLFGSTTFHVFAAPEPVGVVLFMIGATIMGFNLLRRRKVLAI